MLGCCEKSAGAWVHGMLHAEAAWSKHAAMQHECMDKNPEHPGTHNHIMQSTGAILRRRASCTIEGTGKQWLYIGNVNH